MSEIGLTGSPALAPSASSAINLRRAGLAVACLVGLACAAAPPAANWLHADGDLVRLMKAMAAIKGLGAAMLAAAVWRRFGAPSSARIAAAYMLGAGLAAAGVALIFSLAAVMAGSALFYIGVFVVVAAAYRDPELRAGLDQRFAQRRRLKS